VSAVTLLDHNRWATFQHSSLLKMCCICVITTEYTQSGNGLFLASIPSWWKTSPGWVRWGVHAHPLSLHLQSRTKLQCTLQLRGQVHSTYFIPTPMYSVVIPATFYGTSLFSDPQEVDTAWHFLKHGGKQHFYHVRKGGHQLLWRCSDQIRLPLSRVYCHPTWP
jgi:hypothetical protein